MGRREYRLQNVAEQIPKDKQQNFRNAVENVFNQFNPSNTEAIYFGRFIYIPDDKDIDDPANMKIVSVKKTRIDYIEKLPYDELKETLRGLQKKFDLKQGDLRRITTQVRQFQKELSDDRKEIDSLKKLMEDSAESIVNEKQVTKYIEEIEKSCDKLKDSLLLENPEILTDQNKMEVMNKIIVLESYIDDFRQQND